MNNNQTPLLSPNSLGFQTTAQGDPVSSNTHLNNSLISPTVPNFVQGDSSWDQLQQQFTQQMSLKASSSAATTENKATGGNTFVHKLYNMVVDNEYQHLIAWTHTDNSFIVCNIIEFSRDVLPKHFKHNNFSSFVRQLNMYGFHKVNKSPRGHRTLAENQIWEFSHPKFIRDRQDLLDEIKRKALEAESSKKDTNDMNSQVIIMKSAQTDLLQQLSHLQENYSFILNELMETKQRQDTQQKMMDDMMNYVYKQYGSISIQDGSNMYGNYTVKPDPDGPPPIYITSPDMIHSQQQQEAHNILLSVQDSPMSSARQTPPQLSVKTQDLSLPDSPSLGSYQSGTPLSCHSSTHFLSDDEVMPLHSPRSPLTPNSFLNLDQYPQ
ncbi:hypothetical protein K501DRAFT_248967 [Backusella circina FSU 941]|nr:hypothetical protein K501DRAFT_248967 [Backusella circina FSU 941]